MDPLCCIHCRARDDVDHRWCLIELFKTNKIKSVREWQEQSHLLALTLSPKWQTAIKVQSLWRMFVKRRAYLLQRKPRTLVKGRVRIRVAKE